MKLKEFIPLRSGGTKEGVRSISFKEFLKLLAPPVVVSVYKGIKDKRNANEIQMKGQTLGWSGNYTSWEEAKKEGTGYDHPAILEKVKNSLLKVKNGEAMHERDSVLFDQVQNSFPLLAGLMWIAAQNNGELGLIDFGGSLGSSFFQNRLFLKHLKKVSWNIVEQPGFVKTGRDYFENDRLEFFYSIEECLSSKSAEAILLSGVLQYLEEPYRLIEKILSFKFKFIIIDRTSFIEANNDIITVQRTPPEIYEATYPAWFFDRSKMMEKLLCDYELMAEFDCAITESIELNGCRAKWQGFILKRKTNELPRAEALGILGQRPKMPPLRSRRPFIPGLRA